MIAEPEKNTIETQHDNDGNQFIADNENSGKTREKIWRYKPYMPAAYEINDVHWTLKEKARHWRYAKGI